MALKPLYESVVSEANKISHEPKDEDEEDEILEKKLPEVQHHWNEVFNTVTKYNKQLTTVLPTEGNYHYTLLKFSPWLDDAEKALKDIKRKSVKLDENDDLPAEIKEFQRDVVKNQPVHQDYNTGANNLLKRCTEVDVTTDVPFIKDEVQQTNDRWDKLRAGVDDVNKGTVELNKAVKEFERAREPVEECIEAIHIALETERPSNFDLDGLEFFVNELNVNLETMQEKEPDMKDVVKKSEDIASFIKEQGGDPENITQKCADVTNRWKDAKDQVVDKRDKSQTHLKQLAHFVKAVDDLDYWVNATTTTVTNLGPASATPEGVKKQLEQIDAIQEEITKQKSNLLTTEELGDWLCDENKDKPQFCANVQNKLNKVKQPLTELRSILSERKTRLHNVLVATQDFNVAFDDFISELDKLENKHYKQKPISVDWKTLKSQDDEQNGVDKEIQALQPIYEKLVVSGVEIVKVSEKSPDRDALEEKLKDIKKHFADILKASTTRREKMDKIVPKSETYFNQEDEICDWLDKNEKIVKELDVVPVTIDEVNKLDKKVDQLDKEITKEQPVYEETFKSSTMLFIEAANEDVTQDVPETEKRMKRVTDRWNNLKKDESNKKDRVNRYKEIITNYNRSAEALKDALCHFEDALDKRPTFGVDTKKASDQLQRIEELIRKLDTHEPKLKSVWKTSSDIVSMVENDKGDASAIKFQSDNINERFKKVRVSLLERKKSLEKTFRVLNHFTAITKEVDDWCTQTSEEVSQFAPVSKEPEEAKKLVQRIDVSLPLVCLFV